jgi:uncharacterized membrane protein YebE (DUF533 family)
MDYEQIAITVDEFRETLRVMVAAAKAEGFTEEQARDIVAGLWRSVGTDKKKTEDD